MPGALVLSRDERTIKKDLIENTSERLRLRTTREQSTENRVQKEKRRKERAQRIDEFILFCCFVFKLLLCILFVVFFIVLLGPKRTKRPVTREKSSQAPFCSCRVASTQPGT